ncbi:hypothetical protein BD413DRAFT_105292 [Trametes elegans]|nr:hypothetical protein BD413DRAFT_105292 [Trametes elegans]
MLPIPANPHKPVSSVHLNRCSTKRSPTRAPLLLSFPPHASISRTRTPRVHARPPCTRAPIVLSPTRRRSPRILRMSSPRPRWGPGPGRPLPPRRARKCSRPITDSLAAVVWSAGNGSVPEPSSWAGGAVSVRRWLGGATSWRWAADGDASDGIERRARATSQPLRFPPTPFWRASDRNEAGGDARKCARCAGGRSQG